MKKMIFLKVKNSYNKKLVTWLDLNLQVARYYKNKLYLIEHFLDLTRSHVLYIEFNIFKTRNYKRDLAILVNELYCLQKGE